MKQLQFNVDAFRRLMVENNLSQAALARKMGLSRACINRYMNGSRVKPSPKVIDGFSRAFPCHSLTHYFFAPTVTSGCPPKEGDDDTHIV